MAVDVYFRGEIAAVLRSVWFTGEGRHGDYFDALIAVGHAFQIGRKQIQTPQRVVEGYVTQRGKRGG